MVEGWKDIYSTTFILEMTDLRLFLSNDYYYKSL